MYLLKNGNVVYNGTVRQADVLFDTRIRHIGDYNASDVEVIDCSDCLVLPGGVDPHVHFRDFDEDHKEDWQTGGAAAVAGGTTTVYDMPNNRPSITTPERVQQKREKIDDAPVNGHIYGGVASSSIDSLPELAQTVDAFKLYMSASTGDLAVPDRDDQHRCMEQLADTGRVLTVHAEDAALNALYGDRADTHAGSRPPVSEATAVASAVTMAADTGVPLHVAHVSTAESVAAIRNAKERGQNVTAEVCPHHLLFTAEDATGPFHKVNPPLRGDEDREALWKGIRDGTIDMVASDHAPHTRDEKAGESPPSGMPGVQERLPLMLSTAAEHDISVPRIVDACCTAPAHRFGAERTGQIALGYEADIAVFRKTSWELTEPDVASRCGWSNYTGRTLEVQPVMTFVGGEPVFTASDWEQ